MGSVCDLDNKSATQPNACHTYRKNILHSYLKTNSVLISTHYIWILYLITLYA